MTTFDLGLIDPGTGRVIVDDEHTEISQAVQADLDSLIDATPTAFGCAKPISLSLDNLPAVVSTTTHTARISGIWHDSLVEGPGRRSVVRFQGCPIRCAGCWVPETHDPNAGQELSTAVIAEALLAAGFDRDGVTILGGEPFAQAEALDDLVWELRARNPGIHICVYTGYTLESLRARHDQHVDMVLALADLLIDGPYVAALASTAGPWTGSGNQRVLELHP